MLEEHPGQFYLQSGRLRPPALLIPHYCDTLHLRRFISRHCCVILFTGALGKRAPADCAALRFLSGETWQPGDFRRFNLLCISIWEKQLMTFIAHYLFVSVDFNLCKVINLYFSSFTHTKRHSFIHIYTLKAECFMPGESVFCRSTRWASCLQTVEEIEGALGRDFYPSLCEERVRWEKELAGLREENESLTAMLCSKEEDLNRTKATMNAIREERDRLRRRVSDQPDALNTRH